MKNFFLTVSAVSLILGNAHAMNCIEKYQKAAKFKKETRERVARNSLILRDEVVPLVGGMGIAAVIDPLMIPGVVVGAAFMGGMFLRSHTYRFASLDSRENRILTADERAKKQGYGLLFRIHSKAQKVKAEVSLEEVSTLIKQGLESGDFCPANGKLFTPAEVKRYVLDRI